MISFENTEIAFKYKSDRDLKHSFRLFSALARPWLVKLSNTLLKQALKLHFPIGWIVKPTVYRQFVGGVSINDCLPVVRLLEKYRVKAILDYSVEGGGGEKQMDLTLEETLRTVSNAANDPNIPFAVFKPTAFGDLEKIAGLEPGHPDADRYIRRVETLCSAAAAAGVPVMIDAEDSWYQDFVDEVVASMMKKHNRERAIVFNTLQMYRQDRLEHLTEAIGKARKQGYFYG
ncbi:MAG: proline dehydrogenase family protein, partial [Bacteroidetes bacterium]|nr:proline dehydrogenase family protein [Bacteroidota bacterium]